MEIKRYFTKNKKKDQSVFDMFTWKRVDVNIIDYKTGTTLFAVNGVEFPEAYSQNACEIIAKMYFRKSGVPVTDHETSMRQVAHRMVNFWVAAMNNEKLITSSQKSIIYDELVYLLLDQRWAPNSPQWFNTGLQMSYGITGEANGLSYYDETLQKVVDAKDSYTRTQASACFIVGVEDSLIGEQSLMDNLTTASRLFKYGSGIGSNWSKVRGFDERLSSGGKSSGLLSFQRVFDRNAGAIKSGGTTRRAAVMQVLDLDHPEIAEFVEWKSKEEDKVEALGKMGYDVGMSGEAYDTVSGQNVNNSVSIPDEFMKKIESGDPNATWAIKGRSDTSVDREVNAQELWDKIAHAAWRCGDPGVHFTNTINSWHTCPKGGCIRASNPCFTGEMKILTEDGYMSFQDLNNTNVRIFNKNGKISEGKVWYSGFKQAIRLDLSNRKWIECTPNHIFMDITGNEVEAKNLVGKKLIPMMINETSDRFDEHWVRLGFEMKDDDQRFNVINKIFGSMSTRDRVSFLRGCFSYGAIVIPGRGICLRTEKMEYVEAVCNALCDHLHMDCQVMEDDDRGRHCLYIHDYNSIQAFMALIGFNSKFQYEAAKQLLRDESPTIVKIRQISPREVYDFEEYDTHWGVVEGCVVHNCSEYLFLDDTACNIASTNVLKFYDVESRRFDLRGFMYVTRLIQFVLEASIHWGVFPTKQIAENSYKYRTTGLGLTNMGALLMTIGVPYDSDEGRSIMATLCSAMTSKSYLTSVEMAQQIGPFPEYENNKDDMLKIINRHGYEWNNNKTAHHLDRVRLCEKLFTESDITFINLIWDMALGEGKKYGYRNAQVTLLAPTGTTAFAMDCASTSSEPFFSHKASKKLIDGSYMSIVNPVIPESLKHLGYSMEEIKEIVEYINNNNGMIEGAPHLKDEHLPVFDTANRCGDGVRYLSPEAHVKMVAAMQPHLTGSISKTINIPSDATVDDIKNIYMLAWKLGCKCIALYRDGCKVSQPLTTKKEEVKNSNDLEKLTYQELIAYAKNESKTPEYKVVREKLPFEPMCKKNAVKMDGYTFHIQRSFYEDGRLGEIFATVGKQGNTVKGLMEVLCILISKSLQYGIPAEVISSILRNTEFGPKGFVQNHQNIKNATSIPDLISKFIDISIGDYTYCQVKPETNINTAENNSDTKTNTDDEETIYGLICPTCGYDKFRKSGTCHYCKNCGSSNGCS